MEWVRGAIVGRGSSATVSLGIVPNVQGDRRLMAVKSAPVDRSSSLQRERCILADLEGCPQIVRCFGDDFTTDDGGGGEIYNLFLEYVSGGTLSDLARRSGGRLREPDVRFYTRSLLQGLRYVHERGYVHCDVKPQNVLVRTAATGGGVMIVDFGMAKKVGERIEDGERHRLRGTPLYVAPESVAHGEYEASADIWSLGCAVAEMASGRPAWRSTGDGDAWALLMRIGYGAEMPELPEELSEDGKDFLGRCLTRDPGRRWTAEMLLDHPFIAAEVEEITPPPPPPLCCNEVGSSPRSILDISEPMPIRSSLPSLCSTSTASFPLDFCSGGLVDRIRHLATGQRPDWSADDDWITVRSAYSTSNKSDELTVEDLVGRYECRDGNSWDGVKEINEFPANASSEAAIQLVLPSSVAEPRRGAESISVCVISDEVQALRGKEDGISNCSAVAGCDSKCWSLPPLLVD